MPFACGSRAHGRCARLTVLYIKLLLRVLRTCVFCPRLSPESAQGEKSQNEKKRGGGESCALTAPPVCPTRYVRGSLCVQGARGAVDETAMPLHQVVRRVYQHSFLFCFLVREGDLGFHTQPNLVWRDLQICACCVALWHVHVGSVQMQVLDIAHPTRCLYVYTSESRVAQRSFAIVHPTQQLHNAGMPTVTDTSACHAFT